MEHIEVVRSGGRAANQMRPVRLERDVMKNALGSCMVEFGDTRVLCAATIEEGLPAWRRASRAGWVTAEYAMLPASTNRRTRRETSARKGRSMEIERLIGRSLRTVVNLRALGEYTVTVDAMSSRQMAVLAPPASPAPGSPCMTPLWRGSTPERSPACRSPARSPRCPWAWSMVPSCSTLIIREDSNAEVDMNLVATDSGEIVELQGTGERTPFDRARLNNLLDLGDLGIQHLTRPAKRGHCV